MFSSRRSSSLPSTRPYVSHRETRTPSYRLILTSLLASPLSFFLGVIALVLFVAWLFGLTGAGEHVRIGGGHRVVARDWEAPRPAQVVGKHGPKPDQVVMILCPMKNSIEHIWHFFHLLDTLSYPRHLLHLGVLVSDSFDTTYSRALELADERQYSRPSKAHYGRISVFNKDFDQRGEEGNDNVGGARHDFDQQVERRKLLGKSRTWLLGAAMVPEVDWVLWIDVDVVEYDKDLVQTLLGWAGREKADVVVPNCMWKTYNEMGSYDRNNWAETPESLEMKSKLAPDDVLIEGYEAQLKTYRLNMADLYPLTPTTPSSMLLDGVGGCATLVKAALHRAGAIFPAWPVEHQLETEGFAQIAKKLGGKLVGLPGYYVYHGLYG